MIATGAWRPQIVAVARLQAAIHDVELPVVATQKASAVQEVLPKTGLVVSEKGPLSEILCKPKIMPLKSITLQKLEEMEVSIPHSCMLCSSRPPARALAATAATDGSPHVPLAV